MPLDRQWIEQHIPHKGRMCLLDEVLAWDAAHIRCRSNTHLALQVSRHDDLAAELIAAAERVTGDGRTVLYEFTVSSAGQELLSGRASIVFDAAFGAQPAGTGALS